MTTLGYFLGQIEWVQKNLEFITIVVVVLSIVPIWFELRRRSGKDDLADERPRPTIPLAHRPPRHERPGSGRGSADAATAPLVEHASASST